MVGDRCGNTSPALVEWRASSSVRFLPAFLRPGQPWDRRPVVAYLLKVNFQVLLMLPPQARQRSPPVIPYTLLFPVSPQGLINSSRDICCRLAVLVWEMWTPYRYLGRVRSRVAPAPFGFGREVEKELLKRAGCLPPLFVLRVFPTLWQFVGPARIVGYRIGAPILPLWSRVLSTVWRFYSGWI